MCVSIYANVHTFDLFWPVGVCHRCDEPLYTHEHEAKKNLYLCRVSNLGSVKIMYLMLDIENCIYGCNLVSEATLLLVSPVIVDCEE